MLLLPSALAEKKIIEGSEFCDLYNKFSDDDKVQQREGVLKFFDMMNEVHHTLTKKLKVIFLIFLF